MADTKHFRHFRRTHVMVTDKCDLCEGTFAIVELTKSSRDVLFVMCDNEDCDGFILARRRGKLKS